MVAGRDWYEGHATVATNATGVEWAVAEAITGGPDHSRTFFVASGAGPAPSNSLRVVRDSRRRTAARARFTPTRCCRTRA